MRLPVILAQSEVSGSFPQPQASLGAAGAPSQALVRTGEVATGSGLETARIAGAVDAKLRQADAKNEAEAGLYEFEDRLTDEDVRLRSSGVDPDEYVPMLRDHMTKVGSEIATSMKYPEAQRSFMSGVRRVAASKLTSAKWDARKMTHERVKTMTSILNQRDANTAVFGNPEEQQGAMDRALRRLDANLAQEIYTADQYLAERRTFLGTVQRGQVRKDFSDPAMQPAVLRGLVSGSYEYIPPADAMTLAQTLQNNLDAQDRKAREESERARLRAVDDLESRARDRLLSREELEQSRKDGIAIGQDYRRLRDHLDKPDDRGSDPDILARVASQAHRVRPTVSEVELDRLHDAYRQGRPGLSFKDWKETKDKLISRLDHLRSEGRVVQNEGKARAMQLHAQAEQVLDRGLGLSSPNDVLDREDQKLQDLGLQELTARSAAYEGQENPLTVVREILDRIQPARQQRTRMKISTVENALRYKTPESLEQAYQQGQVGTDAYNLERRKFLDIQRTLKRQQDAEAARQQAQPGKATSTPKPSEPAPAVPGR